MDFTAKGKWLTEDGVEWLPVTIEVYDCDNEQMAMYWAKKYLEEINKDE
ncbi:MAG: hypothetical protein M0R03_11035 [Novosphingobium sp.]|nr:hypothetical protein [Novosphingobium sp.]